MKRSRSVFVAVLALAVVALCAAVMVEAGHRMYETIGPSRAVAAPDGSLYVVSQGAVHVFGVDGKRREVIDLARLGAPRIPADVAVQRDGRLIVTDADQASMLRCDRSSAHCEKVDAHLTRVPVGGRLNTAKISVDEEGSRYFISDNAGYRLLEVGFSGELLSSSMRGSVARPNQVRLLEGNRLLVADTDYHRIATFDVTGGKLGKRVGSISAQTPLAHEGHDWPIACVRLPTGEVWALLANRHMKDADIVVFDADGEAMKRIDLGEQADPFDLEVWGDRVLVSDGTLYRVDAFAFDGHPVPGLADERFAAELRDGRQSIDLWRGARYAAQGALVLVPLLAIFLLRYSGSPISPIVDRPLPQGAREFVRGGAVRWIGLDEKFYGRALRHLLIVIGVIIVGDALLFALVLRLLGWDGLLATPGIRSNLLEIAGIALGAALFAPFMRRVTRRRIGAYRLGAASDGLHYESAPRLGWRKHVRNGKVPWPQVYYDGARILAGGTLLLTRNAFGNTLFEPERLRDEILRYIPRENFVTPVRLIARGIGRWYWWLLGALLLFAIGDLIHIVWLIGYRTPSIIRIFEP